MTTDYSFGTYMRFGLAGALCCSITHTAVVPIDVVKTRLQTNPEMYSGMYDAYKQIVKKDGYPMLMKGAGPTALGYFLQGAFKFGFNEFFKKQFTKAVGEEQAKAYRLPIWLGSSACAEFIADLFLCPLEATRIRLVSEPTYAKGLFDGFGKILKNEGFLKFYTGLPPLLLKQIPYTMAKFTVFEITSENIYKGLGKKKEEMADSAKLTISLGSGVVAGIAAAIISQPADTVLSVINKQKTSEPMFTAISRVMTDLGFKGLFRGTGARCWMVGTLTAGQFFIYDYIKILTGVAPHQLAAAAAAAKKN